MKLDCEIKAGGMLNYEALCNDYIVESGKRSRHIA